MNLQFKLPIWFKTKWIAALRSGKFKQDIGYLKTDQGHCCLGVAAEVAGTGFVSIDDGCTYKTPEGSTGVLDALDVPYEVYQALNQREIFNDNDIEIQGFLSNMNDHGNSFNTIADWIENNL